MIRDYDLSDDSTMAWEMAAGGASALTSPADIPQIAAGEWWLPAVGVTGAGALTWAGRNGTNNFVAPGVGAQNPDAVTGPGGNPAWTYVAANSDNFTVGVPAAPLTATDGVYVACWFRFDSLDTTNRVIVEQNGSNGARKWHIRKSASTTTLVVEVSQDGTAIQTSTVSLTEAERGGSVSMLDKYLFLELLVDTEALTLATQTKMWLDLKPITFDSQVGSVLTALFNGGVTRYGNNNFENQDFNGQLGPLYIGKRTAAGLLPLAEHRSFLMTYRLPKAHVLNVVCDGNSIMAGQDTSDPATTGPVGVLRASLVSLSYPSRDTHDRGLSGQTTQQMVDGYPTRVAPFFDAVFARNVFVFFEVRNSAISAAQTAAQIYAQYQALAALARATGFRVVVCTAIPSDGDPVGHGEAGGANALIRAGWQTFADGFVDLELVPEFTPAGNIANPTYYLDGVHPTDLGAALIASKMLTAVLALL